MTERNEELNYPEPMMADFRDADGVTDYEEYDYYHTQWEDHQRWIKLEQQLTQTQQDAITVA